MRRPAASVPMQSDRHLGDPQRLQGRLDDHLGGKFHPGSFQVHLPERGSAKAAQPAMEIAGGTTKKKPANEGQAWIADPAVFPWHGPRRDRSAATRQSAAHDEIVTFAKLADDILCP